MSRIAKIPIVVPSDVTVELNNQLISIMYKKIKVSKIINKDVLITYFKNTLTFDRKIKSIKCWAQVGTARSLVSSMIIGITKGFQKKLNLSGVGYRISLNNKNIVSMSLGYSHVVKYNLPDQVCVEFPSASEIIIKGVDKQLVGQVAANLRSYRIPEVYKGKGIRYDNEIIKIKEAKKK